MYKPAFTLLELLIVMGVSAFLMGLGAFGLMSFQAEVDLQNAYSNIISDLKFLQNKARN
jgi:prepilin-type N-terminal cleavage/methylation domain-containing protein